MAQPVTLTNNIGSAVGNIYFRIVPRGARRIDDGSAVVAPPPIVGATGTWSQTLELNANISPAANYWEVWENIPGADRVWSCYLALGSQTVQQSILDPTFPYGESGAFNVPGLKPIMSGLSDMGGYPFVAGGYPFNGAPYNTQTGTGDYRSVVFNRVATVFWKDLQPASQNQIINPAAVNTITYIAGLNEINTGVAQGNTLATVRNDAAAAGQPLKIRVIGGYWAPAWAKNLPYTDRQGFTAGNRPIANGSAQTVGPFWQAWDPANPHSGYQGAYYDLQVQLALLYENDPTVVEVTCSASLSQDTAEPWIRAFQDSAYMCNLWFAGLDPTTDANGILSGIDAHMAAWARTRASAAMGSIRVMSISSATAGLPMSFNHLNNILTCSLSPFSSAIVGALVATDPLVLPAGTTITGFTDAQHVTMSNTPLRDATNQMTVIFNPPAAAQGNAGFTFSPTTATSACTAKRGQYGPRFLPGWTSLVSGTNTFTSFVQTNPPGWFQTGVASQMVQSEFLGFQGSNDNFTESTTLTNGASSGTSVTVSANCPVIVVGGTLSVIDGTGLVQDFAVPNGYAGGAGAVTITAATVFLATGSGYSCVSNWSNVAATGGTFTVWDGGGVGAQTLNFNATPAQVQTALNNLSTITTDGGVTVASHSGTNPWTITWNSVVTPSGVLRFNPSGLTFGSFTKHRGRVIVNVAADNLASILATGAAAGGSYIELHPGYGTTNQPCATVAQMLPYKGNH